MKVNERILAMTKKHFVMLAQIIIDSKPAIPSSDVDDECYLGAFHQWEKMKYSIVSFCQAQNGQFLAADETWSAELQRVYGKQE